MSKSTKKPTARNTSTRPRTSDWQAAFLTALENLPNVSRACDAAGIDRSTAYRQRQNDPDFATKWDEAWGIGCLTLKDIAMERAMGVNKTYKFDRHGAPLLFPPGHPNEGEPYFEYVASDTMLVTMLKSSFPHEFKDRSVQEISATVTPVQPEIDLTRLSVEELRQLKALREKAALPAPDAPLQLPTPQVITLPLTPPADGS